MSHVIPEGWAQTSFENISSFEKNALKAGPFGSALKKSDYVESGFKVYGQEQVIAGNENLVTYFIDQKKYEQLSSCLVKPGDILISLVGTIGKVLILSDCAKDGIINPRLVKLSLNEQIYKNLIKHFLSSPLAHSFYKSFSHGGTMEILNLSILKKLPIPLPPLAEQKVIADTLDELLAQVESTKARLDAIPAILKSFRQSVLAAAVSGKLTESRSEWRNEQLKNCFECIDGDRGPNYPKKDDYLHSGYSLFLSTKNVRQFGFDFSNTVFISKEKDSILRKGRLERGDIVITTRGTLGYVASYDETVPYDVVRINSGMLILRKKDAQFINDYFKILVASPYFQKLIEDQKTGSAQPQLPAKILKDFVLPIPEYEEQNEIVRRVEELFAFADKVEAQVNAAQLRVNNLTQSILAKAFRGELTADWRAANPELISGENSAQALLERIKTEREKLKPAKKKSSAKKAKA